VTQVSVDRGNVACSCHYTCTNALVLLYIIVIVFLACLNNKEIGSKNTMLRKMSRKNLAFKKNCIRNNFGV
jgi:hypothetical protein